MGFAVVVPPPPDGRRPPTRARAVAGAALLATGLAALALAAFSGTPGGTSSRKMTASGSAGQWQARHHWHAAEVPVQLPNTMKVTDNWTIAATAAIARTPTPYSKQDDIALKQAPCVTVFGHTDGFGAQYSAVMSGVIYSHILGVPFKHMQGVKVAHWSADPAQITVLDQFLGLQADSTASGCADRHHFPVAKVVPPPEAKYIRAMYYSHSKAKVCHATIQLHWVRTGCRRCRFTIISTHLPFAVRADRLWTGL